MASVHPQLAGRIDLRMEDLGPVAVAGRADCVFCCLPHGAAADVVPQLLAGRRQGRRLQRRLPLASPEVYQEWYGLKHADPERLGKVAYGLPELFRERIAGHHCRQSGLLFVECNLALAPFVKQG